MNPLETYLKDIHDIHSTGAAVKETSFYPALSNLLNEIGKTLKPKVRCVINLADRGAGLPDGGLFTPDQFQKGADAQPKRGQPPSRGALEVKSPSEDLRKIACSEQVQRYCAEYGLVLVTNYRDFLLLGRDTQGKPLPMEAYALADNEKAFWAAALHPQKTAIEHGEQFCEYLKRVMLYNAPLSAPQDVAWFLASYARDAKARVENHKDLSALAAVRDALEQALGMKFTGERGEHFFRSTLVQTIFYGVFSAWVLWHRERSDRSDAFNWHETGWTLRVPFIRALYDEIATPTKLGDLGLVEVLDWTASALNRVDRAAFFQKFQDEHAVQYFYEPFLEAFDPELRKELGVWFTPPEIVQYQVARVDTVLREELGLADGLADPNVVVLDPCCGTGAYLVEVLRHIAYTLKAKGGDALIASDLKKAAMTRVFGFEILPAPFVVSHLQLGLMLHRLGAPLSTKMDERMGVYLTNSLTGWEPPKEPKQHLMEFMKELEEERDAADRVKREAKILVILGNPPYNAFAGVSPEEEQGLVEPYKEGLNTPTTQGGWGIKKFNLDDLYVRFFRLAERRICEMNQLGRGVVSFISNFSYLSDPSFVVMRQRFLAEFDNLWFDCMNGDSRETGKLTPDGKPDPSVFSTEYNREGIRVGTAICVMVRKEKRDRKPTVLFRQFWGVNKRQDLLASLEKHHSGMEKAVPAKENRSSFRPENVAAHYNQWPKMVELCEVVPLQGMDEDRANALIDFEERDLSDRIQAYLDSSLDWDGFKSFGKGLARNSAGFNAKEVRNTTIRSCEFSANNIRRYLFRPFDTRYCYYTHASNVWKRHRPELVKQMWESNGFVLTRPKGVAVPEGSPFLFCRNLLARDSMRGHAIAFPLRLQHAIDVETKALFDSSTTHANLSQSANKYLAKIGIKNPDGDAKTAGLIWMHALAIGYSPAYLTENADGIRRDRPRIPLPDSRNALEASAKVGEQIAALLDTEAEVSGVTAGKIDRLLRTIGVLTKVGGGVLDPDAGDLAVTAGWGHAGKGGVTMPAKGRIITRPYDKAEKDAIDEAAKARGFSVDQTLSLLGQTTCDVYLNEKAYWKNVPVNMWEYYIGGYQVIKKWLSYREEELLGRPLKSEEAREVMNITRRLAAIILLQPAVDENYQTIKASTYDWQAKKEVQSESQ